jgi:hypothetical protein
MSYKVYMACAGAFAAAVASAVLALGSLAPAFAHEVRILPADHGKISLVVGFHVEPASEDSFNAVDIILSTFDGACPAPQYQRFHWPAYRCRWNRDRERPRYGQFKGRHALS